VEDTERLQILEARLADLKARMPAHSVRPATIVELEQLEEEIEELRARVRQEGDGDAQGTA
jgi:polyhydroxyalkanoate synthesis regulator phasin